MASDRGLVRALTLRQDWSEQGFPHRTGQRRDSHMELINEGILTWSTGTPAGLVSTPASQQSVPHPEPSAGSFP